MHIARRRVISNIVSYSPLPTAGVTAPRLGSSLLSARPIATALATFSLSARLSCSSRPLTPSDEIVCPRLVSAVLLVMHLMCRPADDIVVHDVRRKRDDRDAEPGEHVTVRGREMGPSVSLTLLLLTGAKEDGRGWRDSTHRNMARLEKMGDLRHASRLAQGSR